MPCQPRLRKLVYKWLNIKQSCALCAGCSDQRQSLCTACELELPWLLSQCARCALPLPEPGAPCEACLRRQSAFEQVVAPWHYRFPVDALVTRFKHRRQWPLGRLLAEGLVDAILHRYDEGLAQPDVLLPVPLARRRLRQRGFNQAEMLAQWLSRPLAVPLDGHCLRRDRHTVAQQRLDAEARRLNLRSAFSLRDAAAVRGRHIALVDDVLTTGATAHALATLLLDAGALRVDVYCLARTPRPGEG